MSQDHYSLHKHSFEGSSFSNSDDDGSGMTLLHKQLVKPALSSSSQRKSTLSTRLLRLLLCFIVLICTVSIGYTALGVHRLSALSRTSYGDCGDSETVAEARAKGCVFDPMSWIWVRPECYDPELVAEFMSATNFSWHTEPKLKEESRVDMEVIYRGDYPKLFTQKEYHTVHCFYMMKKMHKAMLDHRPVDSYLTEWHHTNHCGMVMLNDIMHEDVACTPDMVCPTWVRATWTGCRRY